MKKLKEFLMLLILSIFLILPFLFFSTSCAEGKIQYKTVTFKHAEILQEQLELTFPNDWIYLGTANYVSHNGSRPMNITWRLDAPIPAKYLKKTNKLVVG